MAHVCLDAQLALDKDVESRGKGLRISKLWMESPKHCNVIKQQQIKNYLLQNYPVQCSNLIKVMYSKEKVAAHLFSEPVCY